jgi:hypothetical protein
VSGQLHAPAVLPPGKEPPSLGAHLTGEWVGPRSCLYRVERRKILSLLYYFFWITGFLRFPHPWDWRIKLHTPYMACETHLRPKTKNYTTKRCYQQTRRDKQKTPQIMNDQLDSPYRDSKSEPSVVQPVASRYTDSALTA